MKVNKIQNTDSEDLFKEDFRKMLAARYKQDISEAIKRGIRAKKLKK